MGSKIADYAFQMTKRIGRHIFNYDLRRRETKKTKIRVKGIGGGYRGSSSEYKKTVLQYWKRYHQRPEKCWYDLYCEGKGAYDPRYIPNSIWLTDIMQHFNNQNAHYAYMDKGMYSRLFPDIKKPETVVKRISGYYYDGDGDRIISEEEAKKLILQEEHLIFKPTLYSFGGSGIVFYDYDNSAEFDIDTVLKNLRKGFVAQRLVKQHSDLARINKESVNTIRVITFHFKGQVHVLSTILRMGAAGSRVDNTTAGGSACPIKPDGWLVEKAVNRQSKWTDRHESSGILYKDVKIPSFERIIETAKFAHEHLPYFNIVGWDFAVDKSGDPVLIEYNLNPEQNQISCGPTFGDLTEDVLNEVYLNK